MTGIITAIGGNSLSWIRARGRFWPEPKRDAQQAYDFTYREYTNRSDPMNVLAERVFGLEQSKFMLDRRGGKVQMEVDRGRWRR